MRIIGLLCMLVLFAFASVSTTSDHGTGGIVPTLQWTPRRGVLLTARTAVIVVTTTVFGVLLRSLAATVVRALAPVLGVPARRRRADAGCARAASTRPAHCSRSASGSCSAAPRARW